MGSTLLLAAGAALTAAGLGLLLLRRSGAAPAVRAWHAAAALALGAACLAASAALAPLRRTAPSIELQKPLERNQEWRERR